MHRVRKSAVAFSIVVSLLLGNAAFAARRGDGSFFDHLRAKIKHFIVAVLDDSGMTFPPG